MKETPSPLLEFLLRELSVHFVNGSLQAHQHGYTMVPRTIATHNLIYILRGRVQWVFEDRTTTLGPDQWLVVEPGCRHHARSLTRRLTLLSFHWQLTLPGGRDAMTMLNLDMPLQTDADSRLGRMIRMSREEYERPKLPGRADSAGPVGQSMLNYWSSLIAREMFREAYRQGGLRMTTVDPIVAKMVAWMHDHVEEALDLKSLESVSGYSSQHLNRLFRKSLGLTAMKYFARLRVEHAAQLLRQGRLSISAISQQLGYESPFYFSRVFRQYFGISPRKWQQSQASEHPG